MWNKDAKYCNDINAYDNANVCSNKCNRNVSTGGSNANYDVSDDQYDGWYTTNLAINLIQIVIENNLVDLLILQY